MKKCKWEYFSSQNKYLIKTTHPRQSIKTTELSIWKDTTYIAFLLNMTKFSSLIIIASPWANIAYISVVKSKENRNTISMTEIVKPDCYKQGRIYYTKESIHSRWYKVNRDYCIAYWLLYQSAFLSIQWTGEEVTKPPFLIQFLKTIRWLTVEKTPHISFKIKSRA